MAVMPRPTAAGVLGMVRITAASGPKWRSKEAMVLPAATERMSGFEAFSETTPGSTSSISCGFTAIDHDLGIA